jgi:hypothetical protein
MPVTGGLLIRKGPRGGFWSSFAGPDSPKLTHARWEQEMRPALEKFKKELERPTATWEHKVAFTIRFETVGTNLVGMVYTSDKIYRYLNDGTRPHLIRAKRPGGRLAFYSGGFRPKTAPGSLWASAGSPATTNFRTPFAVNHPGTEARNWTRRATEFNGPGWKLFTSTVRKVLLDVFK